MLILAFENSIDNNILGALDSGLIFIKEVSDSAHEPWKDLLLNSSILWWNQHSNSRELSHCLLPQSSEIILSNSSCINLLMGSLFLLFSGLVLDLSPINLLFTPLLSSLVPLCDDQLCVDNFLVFLLLALHDLELCLLQDLHPGLLESLAAEDIQHWLYLFVEVEQFVVSLEDLSSFAAVL